MPAPVSRHSVPALEAAIVATELQLSEYLAHLAWCRTVGRNTTVAEGLVLSAELRLTVLWEMRHWRLVHGRHAGAGGGRSGQPGELGKVDEAPLERS